MKNLRKEEGITLISLSVTMIVLVILAGVTMLYVVGDNGLVTQAEGIEANAIAAEREAQEQINTLKSEEKYTEDGAMELEDEKSPIVNSFEITEVELNAPKSSFRVSVNVTEAESGIDKIEYSADGGETYVMAVESSTAKTYKFEQLKYSKQYDVKVKVTDKNGNETVVSQVIDNIKIGDYVDYTYDTVSSGYTLLATQSGYTADQTISQNSTALKWRVLNIDDETGKIDLISENETDNTFYFQGALGYNNGVYLLNEICEKLYSNSSRGLIARSVNLEDTEKHLTETGLATRNAYSTSTTQYGATRTYTGNTYYPNLYAKQNGSGINTTTVKTDGIGVSDAYYTTATTETYSQASSLTVTQTAYYDITFNETNYGDAGEILNTTGWYWVASRYTNCNSQYATFGLHFAHAYMDYDYFYYSDGGGNGGSYYLRPLVSIEFSMLNGTDSDGVWQFE